MLRQSSDPLFGFDLVFPEPVVQLLVRRFAKHTLMPRKKSVKHSAKDFRTAAEGIATFLSDVSKGQTDQHISWLYNYAIICLYREFESLMLDALVGAINNDTATISARTGVEFPKHITDEVCEFLISRQGYFDFKGRNGLIKILKDFVPDTHYLVVAVKKPIYKEALERLSALRNFAAHESDQSKRTALKAVGGKRIESTGAWIKRKERFKVIADKLKDLAAEIENAAPY
jgi:hypothetical protein